MTNDIASAMGLQLRRDWRDSDSQLERCYGLGDFRSAFILRRLATVKLLEWTPGESWPKNRARSPAGAPVLGATELTPSAIGELVFASAQAFGDLGEACRIMRNSAGIVDEVRIGGKNLVTEDTIKSEVQHRYQPSSRATRPRRSVVAR